MVSSNGSPKIVIASANSTPCFLTFAAAFSGSHSNSTDRVYAAQPVFALGLPSLDCALFQILRLLLGKARTWQRSDVSAGRLAPDDRGISTFAGQRGIHEDLGGLPAFTSGRSSKTRHQAERPIFVSTRQRRRRPR